MKDWIEMVKSSFTEWIYFNLHMNTTVDIWFISLVYKFHNIIYCLCKLYNDFYLEIVLNFNSFGALNCGLKLLPIMINRRVLAGARMRCVQTFDSFCFQNVLSNGGGDGKNDKDQTTNQPSRIYVGVI